MKRRVQKFVALAYPGLDDELRAADESGRASSLRRGLRAAAEMERAVEINGQGRGYILFLEVRGQSLGGAVAETEASAPARVGAWPLGPPGLVRPPRLLALGGRPIPSICLTPRLLAQRPQATRALRAG